MREHDLRIIPLPMYLRRIEALRRGETISVATRDNAASPAFALAAASFGFVGLAAQFSGAGPLAVAFFAFAIVSLGIAGLLRVR